VESVRGARGGYLLARNPAAISVRDVMTASEHQTFEVNCDSHPVDSERCDPGGACSIRPVWHALQRRVDDLLAGISVADLMKDEAQVQELVGISVAG
jgi:Rrf2 family protein